MDKSCEKRWEHLFSNDINEIEKIAIGINPGADRPHKRWRLEHYSFVLDHLAEKYKAKIFLLGGPGEENLSKQIQKNMKYEAINLAGRLILNDLVYVISRLDLLVTNDSGPMHIAAACNVPVVAIFGSNHPLDSYKEWGPWGTKSRVIMRHDKRFTRHPSDYNVSECMQEITTDEVFSAAVELLDE